MTKGNSEESSVFWHEPRNQVQKSATEKPVWQAAMEESSRD